VILSAHGLRIDLPRGWSGRVFARGGGIATLHAGDFQVALSDGEFGARSTAQMPATASFISLTEYLPGAGLEPGRGLFASKRLPVPLDPASFGRNRLAHPHPAHAGMQHFFTMSGRPLCLYVVVSGPRTARRSQLAVINHVLRTLEVAAA
jgi:hypothetical protein